MEKLDFGIQSNEFPGAEFKVLESFFAVLSFPGVKSRKCSFGDGQLVDAGSYLQNVRLEPPKSSA